MSNKKKMITHTHKHIKKREQEQISETTNKRAKVVGNKTQEQIYTGARAHTH